MKLLLLFIPVKTKFMLYKILLPLYAAMFLFSCSPKIKTGPISYKGVTSTDTRGNAMLLGTWSAEALQQPPYNEWYNKNYTDYILDTAVIQQLKPYVSGKQFEIFLGTWCGDSKREVPRMMKVLEYSGVKPSQIKLIMVNNYDSVYKQSPNREEKGKNIFRVPDLLVYDKRKEKGRIIEYPVNSIEKDLLQMLKGDSYEPHYKAVNILIAKLEKKGIKDAEKEISSITGEIKPFLQHTAELNSFGLIMLADLQYRKAAVAFKINTVIFPDDLISKERLAFTYWKMNDKINAQLCCREILAKNPQNETALKILAQVAF